MFFFFSFFSVLISFAFYNSCSFSSSLLLLRNSDRLCFSLFSAFDSSGCTECIKGRKSIKSSPNKAREKCLFDSFTRRVHFDVIVFFLFSACRVLDRLLLYRSKWFRIAHTLCVFECARLSVFLFCHSLFSFTLFLYRITFNRNEKGEIFVGKRC